MVSKASARHQHGARKISDRKAKNIALNHSRMQANLDYIAEHNLVRMNNEAPSTTVRRHQREMNRASS